MRATQQEYEKIKEAFEILSGEMDDRDEDCAIPKNAVDKGATPVLEPTTEPWGQRTCFIADPEGNIIEIGSWNKPFESKDA